ncbi:MULTISPECIES: hypothetical protein [Alteromonas]|nr:MULTISPECIES: hypothetical protein [Alteromonas]
MNLNIHFHMLFAEGVSHKKEDKPSLNTL